MIDLVKLELLAGDGGHGRVAFRREKYVPKGGPAGGNGGNGGDIILRGSRHLSSLDHLIGEKNFKAGDGQPGGKKKSKGARGEDQVIEVPVGTIVWLLAENQISQVRRQRYDLAYLLSHDEVEPEKYYLEKIGQRIPPRPADELQPILTEEQAERAASEADDEPDAAVKLKRRARLLKKVLRTSSESLKEIRLKDLPKQKLVEITAAGQEVTLCQGGFGGRGNNTFKGPVNTTPLEAEYGTTGEKKIVILEQQLLADVGLVGFPNAGKSTLISVLTEARPKTANYPFTTLEPHLGILKAADRSGAELVMADIPGLVEGASQGKGLGHAFLRHVEHSRLLLVLLYLPEEIIFDESLSNQEKVKQLLEQQKALQGELENYGPELVNKSQLVVVNKIDLYSPALIEAMKAQLPDETILISAVTQNGLDKLKKQLFQLAAAEA